MERGESEVAVRRLRAERTDGERRLPHLRKENSAFPKSPRADFQGRLFSNTCLEKWSRRNVEQMDALSLLVNEETQSEF